VFYLVSVVCAGLTHIVVTAGLGRDLAPILGASGGVFGLLLAFGLYYPRRRLMLLFPPIPIQAGYFVILYGLLELVLGVTGTAMGIAHFAHLGGMLGAFLFIVYRRPRASGR
jgi:membrane associated rhomboid family serine protease